RSARCSPPGPAAGSAAARPADAVLSACQPIRRGTGPILVRGLLHSFAVHLAPPLCDQQVFPQVVHVAFLRSGRSLVVAGGSKIGDRWLPDRPALGTHCPQPKLGFTHAFGKQRGLLTVTAGWRTDGQGRCGSPAAATARTVHCSGPPVRLACALSCCVRGAGPSRPRRATVTSRTWRPSEQAYVPAEKPSPREDARVSAGHATPGP